MKKTKYQKPIVSVVKAISVPLLTGTTQSMTFDPRQGTSEALSRGSRSQEWDDDE